MRVAIASFVLLLTACGADAGVVDEPIVAPAGDACAWSDVKLATLGTPAPETDFGGFCLEQGLSLEASGRAPCVVFVAPAATGAPCSCDAQRGRTSVEPAHEVARVRALEELDGAGIDGSCLCELAQATGDDLIACQAPTYPDEDFFAFCYVDANASPPVGDPEIAAHCESGRLLFFVGAPLAAEGETFVALCGEPSCTQPPP